LYRHGTVITDRADASVTVRIDAGVKSAVGSIPADASETIE